MDLLSKTVYMTKWESSAAKRVFVKTFGQCEDVMFLSGTNNPVWRVKCSSNEYVVKEIRDKSVDIVSEQTFLSQLNDTERFRQILTCCHDEDEGIYVAVYPYINGESFDKVVNDDNYSQFQAKLWADQIETTFNCIRSQSVERFGKRDSNKNPQYNRWMDFVYDYLENQKSKGPIMATYKYDELLDVFKKYEDRIDGEVLRPSLVCGDCNLRNYIVDNKGNLICIHTPMLWHADPALPYGDLMVHLDQTNILTYLINPLNYPEYRLHLYAAFSAYAILVFTERFSKLDLKDAKPWGRKRSLIEIFNEHISCL